MSQRSANGPTTNQGDVCWADLGAPSGSAPGYRRPVVIVQGNAFNRSDIRTVVVCIITSNMARAIGPGNVPLAKGEANLPKRSVVNVTQITTIDRSALRQKIGTVSKDRLQQILAGIALVLSSD